MKPARPSRPARKPWLATRWLWAGLAALALAAAVDAGLWWRQAGINAQVESAQIPAETAVPVLQFAQAQALTTALDAAPGSPQAEAALRAWRRLHEDPGLGPAARYNAANLLLRQAQAVLASDDANRVGQALPLLELAKEQYRALLRETPGFWDARYNLERAQRLQPDPEEEEAGPAGAQQESEQAPTRVRAQAIGLP